MPGKKIPTRILEARGGFKNRPSRKREGEPEVTSPLGNPPDNFTEPQREAWQELAARAPVGVLTSADWQAVVIASTLMAEFQRDPEAMNAAKLSRLHSLLGDCGMTPSARASLNLPQPKAPNPFDEL